jgi:iron complex outermembrane receptor protein
MTTARIRIAIAALALACTSAHAQSDSSARTLPAKVTVNIESQPIRSALQAFGKQTGIQVLFRSENVSVEGLRTPRVTGELSAQEALDRLLANTGLKYEFVNEHTVRISSAQTKTVSPGDAADPPRIPGGNGSAQTDTAYDQTNGPALAEIIVTAQKKAENLLDVPVPVTAIDAQVLAESNQLRLQDYYNQIPGLTLTPVPAGAYANTATAVTIRGLTTNGGNPTVGITIDGVPYGSSTNYGGGAVPDIDPSELVRIEVLRGPQGTLYGASSIGGLINLSQPIRLRAASAVARRPVPATCVMGHNPATVFAELSIYRSLTRWRCA